MRRKSPSLVPGPRDPKMHSSLSLVCVAARRRRRGREGRTGAASFTSLPSTRHYASSRLWWICWRPRRLGLVRPCAPGGRWIDNCRHRNRSLHASESDCRRLLFRVSRCRPCRWAMVTSPGGVRSVPRSCRRCFGCLGVGPMASPPCAPFGVVYHLDLGCDGWLHHLV